MAYCPEPGPHSHLPGTLAIGTLLATHDAGQAAVVLLGVFCIVAEVQQVGRVLCGWQDGREGGIEVSLPSPSFSAVLGVLPAGKVT